MSTPPPVGSQLAVEPHQEWFHTGDLGSLDGDGNLTYIDRVKDSLRRRGENMSSVEVETTVMRHPAVLEAAAVAVPSDLGEDDILVVVTLRPAPRLDMRELLDFCSARMPYFCVPRYLEVLDEIPKNVIGRVRKDVLRNRGLGDERLGPRSTRLHAESLGRENNHMTMTYQQEFVLDGRGRARGDPQPERAAQPAVLRGRPRAAGSRRSATRARRSSRAGETFTDLREAFDGGNGQRLVTVDHEITVDGVDATQHVSRCCSAATNCGPPACSPTGSSTSAAAGTSPRANSNGTSCPAETRCRYER